MSRGSESVLVLVSVGAVGRWAAVGSVATVAKVRCNTSYCQHQQQHPHTSTSAGTHLITVHWCSTHPDQTAGDRNYLSFLYMRQSLILQHWQCAVCSVHAAALQQPIIITTSGRTSGRQSCSQQTWHHDAVMLYIYYHHSIFIPLPPPPFWHKIIFTSINQWI